MQNCWRKVPDKIVFTDRQTDSHGDSSIPPSTSLWGGYEKCHTYNREKYKLE